VAFGGCAIAWLGANGGFAVAHDFAIGGFAYAQFANDAIAQNFMQQHSFFSFSKRFMENAIWLGWATTGLAIWQLALRKGKKKKE